MSRTYVILLMENWDIKLDKWKHLESQEALDWVETIM